MAGWTSSLSEKPRTDRPRRLSHWINAGQEKKVHSLVDKVYSKKNLALAWKAVKENRGAGGVDGVSLADFETNLDENLRHLGKDLRTGGYKPQPLRRVYIPKTGKKDELRPLSIPSIGDRVVQQALVQRLSPIFEQDLDDGNFGYRPHRSTHDALKKVWRELMSGNEWVVDADLKDFFGSVDHSKLMELVARRVSDGKVLRLIERILQAPVIDKGQQKPTKQGTPQGGGASPLLANILLTPFDKEMRARGYRLTRYADDWVITCSSRAEANTALETAKKILEKLGVVLHQEKTRIVHVTMGFQFLGYTIRRGTRRLQLAEHQIKSGAKQRSLYATPHEKARQKFKDRIRSLTRRRTPLNIAELIRRINPVIRGWGNYFRRAKIRKLFHQLDGWIERRIWSHRFKRWRNRGWKELPTRKLCGELGLIRLTHLIPSLERLKWAYSS